MRASAPPPAPRRIRWDKYAAYMRAHPRQWFRVGEHARSMASLIRTGRVPAFAGGGWETRYAATDTPERAVIWVRYVGTLDAAAEPPYLPPGLSPE